ncbi:MAG: hypothetical protein ACFE9L_21980 [Candidatus Hodarchaeota archaeon]
MENTVKKQFRIDTVTVEVNTAATEEGWTSVTDLNTTDELPLYITPKNPELSNPTLSIICTFEIPTGAWTHCRIVVGFREGDLVSEGVAMEWEGSWDYSSPIETIFSPVYEYS